MPSRKQKVVVSIGGSVFLPESSEVSRIRRYATLLSSASTEHKLYVVVGGGNTSRYYIGLGRRFGIKERHLDEMGIAVTRLNARLLIAALNSKSNPRPAESIEEAVNFSKEYPIIVMGGTVPGHTTDAVAAMLAERIGAHRLVNATSVDGIYTSDPKRTMKAKRIERLDYQELLELTKAYRGYAGPNIVFDPLGASIVARARIPLYVVDGDDMKNLRAAIEGRRFHGSVVE